MLLVGDRSSQIDLSRTIPPISAQPSHLSPVISPSRSAIRHILLGPPAAVRQTIHLLHTLNYAETLLWSPLVSAEEPLVITPEEGEVVSLLRKHV